MEEKLYETLAKEATLIIHDSDFVKGLKDITKNMMNVRTNKRYSDFGKEEMLKGMREEFTQKNKEQTEKLRDVIKRFCDAYGVTIPDDNKNHSAEIANVLQIIEICGMDLTVETLKTAIEPIKDSAKLLKMVRDILNTKKEQAPMGVKTYAHDIFTTIDEYLGMTEDMLAYVNNLSVVSSLLDVEELVKYVITDDYSYGVVSNGGYIFGIRDVTSYPVICLGDNMMGIGKLYDRVSRENPRFFK
jgi:uncharacterized protein YqgV (UPF0045/DUF77 family)